jgi:C-terminal processing protease CtpA/Prc
MPNTKLGVALTLFRFVAKDKSLFLLTQGLGLQPFHGRIVILVNEWTNSAAEMVANFAAENRLATTIGTKTAGNILGARNFKLGPHYWVRLPVFGWLTPNGESLDGKGLIPDHIVDVDAASLCSGRDLQIEKAVDLIADSCVMRGV